MGWRVTQFTYFQQIASINCKPITCEITYGVERLALHIQEKEDVYELYGCRGKMIRETLE
ncbi:MAG: hypothetical protein CM15mP58_10740 [Burkholderiaceae bacterium]|nr:MAG: hypothetical protein CM15mP58_10740 [Burkholderiaceae bacterium]